MTYRLLADENVERATVTYLQKLGHDIEGIGAIDELGLGATDEAIASYARTQDRVILTQDDDFIPDRDADAVPGVLFQPDQTLTAREVGDAVHELAQHVDQSDLTLEYVSTAWL